MRVNNRRGEERRLMRGNIKERKEKEKMSGKERR